MTRILNNDNDPVNGLSLSLSFHRTNESPTMTERMGSSSDTNHASIGSNRRRRRNFVRLIEPNVRCVSRNDRLPFPPSRILFLFFVPLYRGSLAWAIPLRYKRRSFRFTSWLFSFFFNHAARFFFFNKKGNFSPSKSFIFLQQLIWFNRTIRFKV